MKPENYLDIAELVLRTARRPLSARAMMEAAHRGGIVPPRLFGKTQHKTLHARLSEDVLNHKLESRFYRTDPGLFFLSEFRSDPTIPNEFKDPFYARRRARDLEKADALALDREFLRTQGAELYDWKELFRVAGQAGALKHVNPQSVDESLVPVWAFSIVRRSDELLCYRIGRYRDQRDAFANHKSIGFAEMVSFDDLTLFSDDMGVTECGLNAVMSDLDLSQSATREPIMRPSLSFAVISIRGLPEPVALFVMEWECPDWFEPTARRLSLNDVRWIDATRFPNDIEDYEPWSAIAFEALIKRAAQKHAYGKTNNASANCIFSS